MTGTVPIMIERGPKGKKVVACALDWPGWSRGASTEDSALEVLESYRDRYRPVAVIAGRAAQFDAAGDLDIVERIEGTGSTDFWGISFVSAAHEGEPMSEEECERGIALLQASWTFFDDVSRPGRDRLAYLRNRTWLCQEARHHHSPGRDAYARGASDPPAVVRRGDSRIQRRG